MNKFGAVRTTVDGITFDSRREAARYGELSLMLKAGIIRDLTCHPIFPLWVLTPTGEVVSVGKYVSDFEYYEGDRRVVEDVKGVRTAVYRLKRLMAEAIHNITITELR